MRQTRMQSHVEMRPTPMPEIYRRHGIKVHDDTTVLLLFLLLLRK